MLRWEESGQGDEIMCDDGPRVAPPGRNGTQLLQKISLFDTIAVRSTSDAPNIGRSHDQYG